jgi:hypothetical protein
MYFFAAQEACPEKFELKGLVALVTDKWKRPNEPVQIFDRLHGFNCVSIAARLFVHKKVAMKHKQALEH